MKKMQPPSKSSNVVVPALTHVSERQARFLRELIPVFLIECPQLLSNIRQAIDAKDAAQLKFAAHTLKSSLLFLGDTAAAAPVHRLEAMGRSGDLTEAEAVFTVLTKSLEEMLPTLRDFVK